MIVLDASVLIAFLDGEDEHHGRAETLLAREIDDDFGASALTLAEVLVVPARENRCAEVRAALQDLDVHELPFPDNTAARLAGLRSGTGLKMPDCCVLLAAEHVSGRVASFDGRLTQAAVDRELEALDR